MPTANNRKERPVATTRRGNEAQSGATDQTGKEPKWQCLGPIQDDIIYLSTTTDWTPAQVNEKVKADLTRKKRDHLMPSKRTVERMVKFYRTAHSVEPWSVASSEAEDATLILEVLADVLLLTNGQKKSFSKEEAEWVLKVRKMVPDAELYDVWWIARSYYLSHVRGLDTNALDMYLAFKPWRCKGRYDNYRYALKERWFPEDLFGYGTWLRSYYRCGKPDYQDDLHEPERVVCLGPDGVANRLANLEEGVMTMVRQDMDKLVWIRSQNPALAEEIVKALRDAEGAFTDWLYGVQMEGREEPFDETAAYADYRRLLASFEGTESPERKRSKKEGK